MTSTDEPRGRTAKKPSHIPAKGWKDILLRTKDELEADLSPVSTYGTDLRL